MNQFLQDLENGEDSSPCVQRSQEPPADNPEFWIRLRDALSGVYEENFIDYLLNEDKEPLTGEPTNVGIEVGHIDERLRMAWIFYTSTLSFELEIFNKLRLYKETGQTHLSIPLLLQTGYLEKIGDDFEWKTLVHGGTFREC